MTERVVMLGFDAMDPGIVSSLSRSGRLPAFAKLLGSSATAEVRNPVGLFVGSLWSTFFTARSAARTGFHCWEEIVPESYERRLTTAAEIDGTPFWEALSAAGKRVAVIDVPHSRAGEELNGVAISEWGSHDRHFGLRTSPPELAAEIARRYGFHPALGADPFSVREWAPDDYLFRAGPHRSADEEAQLLAAMLAGAQTKTRMSSELLAQEPWDLFISVFGEPHSIGHQSWHQHDPGHRRHDAALRARIGDPLEQVYELMDRALATHLEELEDDSTLLVFLSHGIGPHHDGTHLLPEILRLLDASYRGGTGRSWRRRALGGLWALAPAATRASLRGLLAARLRERPAGTAHDFESPQGRRDQLFFQSPNNFVVGGVRINVRGREANGQVEPGAEFDALCERLAEDFLALINVETGGPVVTGVKRTDRHYPRSPDDRLPDLFLEWDHEAPIETVWSPRFGLIHGPYVHWRTGDHRPGGLLIVHGRQLEPGLRLPEMRTEDLAPTIAARLGVQIPDVDGTPHQWPATRARAASSLASTQ